MNVLSGLVGVLLVLTADSRVGNSSALKMCRETEECLLFDLICESNNYEARHYNSVKWVSTDEPSCFMEIAAMRAFRRLFQYISGANDQGQKVEMTSPVIMRMPGGKRFWSMGIYTLSFVLPSKHQETPPKPTNDRVYVHQMPEMKVYAQSYGGWMTGVTDRYKAYSLSSVLDSVDAKYEKVIHYGVGYNSPMTMLDRHNEVWFVAHDDPKCSSSEEKEFSLFS
uniref:heme-binding protein 2-like n=1 Tax=Semicossyphus pulcher TaxID=241346 RepID=UPI0037E8B7D2